MTSLKFDPSHVNGRFSGTPFILQLGVSSQRLTSLRILPFRARNRQETIIILLYLRPSPFHKMLIPFLFYIFIRSKYGGDNELVAYCNGRKKSVSCMVHILNGIWIMNSALLHGGSVFKSWSEYQSDINAHACIKSTIN